MIVRCRHLRRRHEVVVEALKFEHILRELRQLPRSNHACFIHNVGREHLRIAVLLRVEIHHKVDAGTLKACAEPLVEGKACARDLCRTLRIEHAEFFPDVPMRLRLEVECTRCTPAAHLRILRVIHADRHIRLRHVRDLEQQLAQPQLHITQILVERRDLIAERAHLRNHIVRALARLLAHADLLRNRIAARLLLLHVLQNRAAALLKFRERREIERVAAVLEHLLHLRQILAHKFHIQHQNHSI